MHPSGRFSEFVGQDEGNVGCRVSADTFASSTSKAIAHRIMEEIKGVEVLAGCSVKTKGVPELTAGARRGGEKRHHSVPG